MAVAAIAPQGTAVVGFAESFTSPYRLEPVMAPICATLRRRLRRLLNGRWQIVELEGECLHPRITARFAIVDCDAEIRAGDVVSLGVLDFHTAFARTKGQDGFSKRFRGVSFEAALLECECTNPAWIIHTGLTNIEYAYRVRATAPTLKEARRRLLAVRRNPAAYDEPLM